jgi:MFS-type transporter involved in bile tolerance (Atg22 family)
MFSDNNNNNNNNYDGIQVPITRQDHDHYYHHRNTASLRCISYLFGFGPDTPIEATGLSIDIFARATVGMSSMFIGPALLQLASDAAGCPSNDNDSDTECNLRIYGFRPSSLLSNIAVASGLLGCVTLPIFGSIVDHTHYRRHVGAYTAAFLTILKAIEISIGPHTWFLVAVLQIVAGFLFNFHLTATYAYISELSSDSTIQSNYNSSFYVTLYVSSLLFLATVLGSSYIFHLNDIGTSRISQCVTTIVCATSFTIAWKYYFTNRPARSQVPDGMNLVSCGIMKAFQTSKDIFTSNPPLTLLLTSLAFSEAAAMTLITVSTTYMKLYLKMNAGESKCCWVIFF